MGWTVESSIRSTGDGRVRTSSTTASIASICAAALCVLLAGCANDTKSGGDPGARPLPAGMTCPSVKTEMDKLVSRGVSSSIEGRQAGRKLSPQQNTDADRYNELLSHYLGARCHA